VTRILVTGSRSITSKEYVFDILNKHVEKGDTVIQGGAVGVDSIALEWCQNKSDSMNINFKTIRPVNPKDKISYLYRNAEMIGMCDIVIAIWDGKSRGTLFTTNYAKARGLEVIIYDINKRDKKL
jgi:predicted Rossmann fold nucleotide-binding protein DprA/Smf involved in DNA uptake